MAKDKQQKKKDREKRVAKEKLEAAAKRREQESTPGDAPKKTPKTFGFTGTGSNLKPQTNAGRANKQFTQRRSGGG